MRTSTTVLARGPVDDVSLVFDPGQSDPSGLPTPLVWYYNPARHDEAGIARRADRFRAILNAALADPDVRLEDIPRLGTAEDADIRAWEQGPPLPAQPPQPVHLRFLAEAAARLAAEGVKPEEPVGLCLAPSVEQIAGFLGILISGAASLQLDPLHPPARLRAMIAGVGCRLVLTDRHSLGLLPDDGSVRAIRLDDPDAPLAARAATLLRADAVWNMYGPTEATIDATAWRIDPTVPTEETPIGRPVAGYTVRILDDRLRRAPVGAVGEICIGGYGLARGYLGMATETEAAFVADPFAPGERMYRTGDRAQWRDDGAILFRGRRDDQVKIRGQRIELGDVEAALLRQEGVTEAAAVFDKETGALTAHVAGSAAERDLRARLTALLPAAAVPNAWAFHDRLPRLASGKIDRAGLARALPVRAAPPSTAAPARGQRLALQRAVGAVWAELLGRDRIDPEANLFEIGVHSLMVPKAQAR